MSRLNLAPESFAAFGLADEVAVLLDATGMAPDRLVIELTERTLIDHPDAVRANMMALRRRGVRIALDDFGVGYSALGLLKAFPFDKLKLDRLLVQDLTTDARADAIARAAIRLGHDLGCGSWRREWRRRRSWRSCEPKDAISHRGICWGGRGRRRDRPTSRGSRRRPSPRSRVTRRAPPPGRPTPPDAPRGSSRNGSAAPASDLARCP